jgi:hypothetical protein
VLKGTVAVDVREAVSVVEGVRNKVIVGEPQQKTRKKSFVGKDWVVVHTEQILVAVQQAAREVSVVETIAFDPYDQTAAKNVLSQPGCRFVVRMARQKAVGAPTSASQSRWIVWTAISAAVAGARTHVVILLALSQEESAEA